MLQELLHYISDYFFMRKIFFSKYNQCNFKNPEVVGSNLDRVKIFSHFFPFFQVAEQQKTVHRVRFPDEKRHSSSRFEVVLHRDPNGSLGFNVAGGSVSSGKIFIPKYKKTRVQTKAPRYKIIRCGDVYGSIGKLVVSGLNDLYIFLVVGGVRTPDLWDRS